jgi:hypothetical protein
MIVASTKEVKDTRTPEQIEADMVEQVNRDAVEAAKHMKPADMAAQFFTRFYGEYRNRVMTLSNKEARRLAEAIVQFPLIDNKPHFSSTAGKEAFGLGLRLIDAKLIMRETVHMEEREEAEKQSEQDQTTETKENENVEL